MTAVVEVCVSVRLEADAGGGHGISSDAETIVDEFGVYFRGLDADDALAGAEEILESALRACRARAQS